MAHPHITELHLWGIAFIKEIHRPSCGKWKAKGYRKAEIPQG